jgi:hypothetical protein
MLVEKLRFYFSKPLLNSPVGPFPREFLLSQFQLLPYSRLLNGYLTNISSSIANPLRILHCSLCSSPWRMETYSTSDKVPVICCFYTKTRLIPRCASQKPPFKNAQELKSQVFRIILIKLLPRIVFHLMS